MPITKLSAHLWSAALALSPYLGAQDGLTMDGVESVDGSDLAAAELLFDPVSPYPGQVVRVSVELLLRDKLLYGSLLQLFRRELDLQVQLRFPALQELGLTPLPESKSTGLRYALGDAIGLVQPTGQAELNASPATGYRASWSLRAERPGELIIQGPQLRFAYTSGFRPDTLAGSVAMDRIEAVVQAKDGLLRVRAFPEAGRPMEFRGDLGPLKLSLRQPPQQVTAGRAFSLALVLSADEHGPSTAQPSFPLTEEFNCRSITSQATEDTTTVTVTYSVEATGAGQLTLPAFSLAYFDPSTSSYGLAQSAPLTLDVSADDNSGVSAPSAAQGPSGSPERSEAPAEPWPERLALPFAAVLLLILWRRRARRKGTAREPLPPTTNTSTGTPLAQLRGALEARLGQSPAALTKTGLERSLKASGLSADLAQSAASLFAHLDGERFGGPALPDPETQVQALLERLSQACA